MSIEGHIQQMIKDLKGQADWNCVLWSYNFVQQYISQEVLHKGENFTNVKINELCPI